MKKILLTAVPIAIFISAVVALPLTAMIFQESAKLANEVAAWNKQCGNKPIDDEACMKKRNKISGDLGQFVALVNNEIDSFRQPVSEQATEAFLQEFNGRRKIMELERRNALHLIKCLGLPASDPQCSEEASAIDQERASLEAEYKQTHAVFDGKWISLHVNVSPAPKKP